MQCPGVRIKPDYTRFEYYVDYDMNELFHKPNLIEPHIKTVESLRLWVSQWQQVKEFANRFPTFPKGMTSLTKLSIDLKRSSPPPNTSASRVPDYHGGDLKYLLALLEGNPKLCDIQLRMDYGTWAQPEGMLRIFSSGGLLHVENCSNEDIEHMISDISEISLPEGTVTKVEIYTAQVDHTRPSGDDFPTRHEDPTPPKRIQPLHLELINPPQLSMLKQSLYPALKTLTIGNCTKMPIIPSTLFLPLKLSFPKKFEIKGSTLSKGNIRKLEKFTYNHNKAASPSDKVTIQYSVPEE